jgi:hypothetical protein
MIEHPDDFAHAGINFLQTVEQGVGRATWQPGIGG